MASKESPLTVIRSPTAIGELHEIWRWNAERHGVPHADDYLRYLKEGVDGLGSGYAKGKAVRGTAHDNREAGHQTGTL